MLTNIALCPSGSRPLYQTVLLIFLFITFAGTAYSQKTDHEAVPVQIEKVSDVAIRISDNVFIEHLLYSDLTYQRLKTLYTPADIKTVPYCDKPLHAQKSTTLSFTSGDDYLEFINNTSQISPSFLNLFTPKVTIDKQLKIGASKEYFIRRYKLKSVPDQVTVSDIEGGCSIRFIYRNGRLYNIRYNAILD